MKYDDYIYRVVDYETGEVIAPRNKDYTTIEIRKERETWIDKAKGNIKRNRLITIRLVKKKPKQLELF